MSLIDRTKLYYDQCKHMTTLAVGANTLVIAFFDKLSALPTALILVPISVTIFSLALAVLIVAMMGFASHAPDHDTTHSNYVHGTRFLVAGAVFLWSGFGALLIFIWLNFLSRLV